MSSISRSAVHGCVATELLKLATLSCDVDGTPVRGVEDLLSAVEERQAGQVVTVRVLRGCDPKRAETLKARLGGAR